ncbi:MAG: OB-fold nucleic acid binding domain-containing protein, partial [Candidatus Latescibacteria bacterium]|nr:OB-fold nucleic acid binding domain-containing protein [Candidatus Latescibacterota bacterium]
METIHISQLQEHIGQPVTLHGWVHTLRDQKHVQFLILRNRTGSVQIFHEKAANSELAEKISSL